MFCERISARVIAVVDFNGGIIGYISKGVEVFHARKVGDRKCKTYTTEREAAAHFGF